jgi:hypothetical protein
MRQDEVQALVEFIDTRISSATNFQVRRGVVASINMGLGYAEVNISDSGNIYARYDINAGFQTGDEVSVLSIGGDGNLADSNVILGKYSGTPNPFATNLISNGDMESGLSYWTAGENIKSMTVDTTNSYMGDKCLAFTVYSDDSEADFYQQTPSLVFRPNELYKVGGYFRTDSESGAYVKVRTQWFNATSGASTATASESDYIFITSGSGYVPVEFTETSPPDASACKFSVLFRCLDVDYPVYADNVGVYGYGLMPATAISGGGAWVDLSTNQTIDGIKTFDHFPLVPSGTSHVYADELVEKAYVDYHVSNINNPHMTTLSQVMGFQEVTDVSVGMVQNNSYIVNRGSLVTLTLPVSADVGGLIKIIGKGAGGWKIAQNSGQTIHFNSSDTTTGVTGYLASTNRYNCLELLCITTDSDWIVASSEGNITIA